MPLSSEAVIAIVTLCVTCPPSLYLLWKVVESRNRHSIEDGEITSFIEVTLAENTFTSLTRVIRTK